MKKLKLILNRLFRSSNTMIVLGKEGYGRTYGRKDWHLFRVRD